MDEQTVADDRARGTRAVRWLAPVGLVWVLGWDLAGAWVRRDQLPVLVPGALLIVVESVVALVVGLLVVRRQPRNVVGLLLVGHALAVALVMSGDETASGGAVGAWATQLTQGSWVLLYVFIALVGYVFPTGSFLSARWRRFVAACLAGHVVFLVAAALDAGSFREANPAVRPPFDLLPEMWQPVVGFVGVTVGLGSVLALLVGAVAAAVVRLRRAEGEERRQLLWFSWAAISIPGGLALCWLDYWLGAHGVLQFLGVTVLGTVLPLAIGVAVLRNQLFDIELVLSRTVTYGVLTVLVLGTYAVLLGSVRLLAGGSEVAGLLAVAVVAVTVHPVHAAVRRRVERWVYGDRADPYAALRRLSDRLQTTADPQQVVRTVAATVAEALRVERVDVELDREVVAAAGPDRGRTVAVPLAHHGQRLGRLVVHLPSGRGLTPSDHELLHEMARHAGVVVDAVYLGLDLQQSRVRLVTAREEERRRLRRDLHDGLGPSLAAIVLKLNAVSGLVDDERAGRLLLQLREETRHAIDDIRRLVDDLRPPALDEVGLVDALRQRAATLSREGGDGPTFAVDGPVPAPPLPAAAEVAAYRIATEAMANALRHSGASACTVTVTLNGSLEVRVADNGFRPWDDERAGVGLVSMRERAAELGGSCTIARRAEGGTVVRAVLPLPRDPEPSADQGVQVVAP
ncbi:MAG: histidine kinase [Sporichthyaceae bacterium]